MKTTKILLTTALELLRKHGNLGSLLLFAGQLHNT